MARTGLVNTYPYTFYSRPTYNDPGSLRIISSPSIPEFESTHQFHQSEHQPPATWTHCRPSPASWRSLRSRGYTLSIIHAHASYHNCRDSLIVIYIQLRIRVRGTRSLKRNPDKVLAEDVVEDAATERAVFLEDFVDDVLHH